MKVSIITVAFNSAPTIAYAIDSFLAQSHTNAELLIIDGASTDDTVAIARSYSDPRISVLSEPDEGLFDAMNKGLRLYSGEAVGFLNSDDSYHGRDALARIAGALEDADVVHGNIDFVSDHARKTVIRRWRGSPHRPGAFREGWMPAHPTFYVRRSLAERIGGFDPELSIAADYDFMLRALETGLVTSAFVDDVLVDMMVGGNSTQSWRSYVTGNLESLRSRRKWLGSGFVDYALFAKPTQKVRQYFPAAKAT